jgi:hypothetical protein
MVTEALQVADFRFQIEEKQKKGAFGTFDFDLNFSSI